VKPLIIVADDHEVLRFMLGSFLRSRGFRVLTAGTGRDALALCRRIKPPIKAMITEPAEKAARIRPAMPVVFMSGAFIRSDAAIRTRLGPGRAFLEKPFSWMGFESALESVFDPACVASASHRMRPWPPVVS
jgi:CheY-like chemotaxis protein